MNSLFKNTKIVSTSGPAITKNLSSACDCTITNPEYFEVLKIFEDLFVFGVNCVRFNFSHSNADERLFRIDLIHNVQNFITKNAAACLLKHSSSKLKFFRPVTNMCDTKGPEIRVYKFANSNGCTLQLGSLIKVHCLEKILGNEEGFSVLDSTGKYNMANDCKVGNKILVDDGKLSIAIVEVDKEKGIVTGKIENTHILKSNKRINLPGADYSMPFLSENDISDIQFSYKHNFHLIALSFVNKAQDIRDVRNILLNCDVKNKPLPLLFSKIETLQSLKNIDEIIEESDGIMVARGDLGLEIPFYEVPYWTKVIIKKCAIKNIPVIVATQMLDSLEKNIIPTRAEVTDVYRAAELGADSTMLSGETAQGLFPVIAVKTMNSIVCESEKRSNHEKFIKHFKEHPKFKNNSAGVDLIVKLFNLCKQHDGTILSIAAFSKDLNKDFLTMFSAAKLPVGLTVFEETPSYEASLSQYSLTDHSLFRGVNHVAVINFSNEPLLDCFNDYCHSFCYKFDCSFVGKKVILFENNDWIIKNL